MKSKIANHQKGMLEDMIKEFLDYLLVEKQLSEYTIRNYRHYLRRFWRWVKERKGSIKVTEIDGEMIRQYRVYLAKWKDDKGEGLAPVTQGYYVIALRSFLRFLLKNDYEVLSPDKLELPKGRGRRLKFLTFDQFEEMVAGVELSDIRGYRDRAILEVLFATGLRVSELVALNKEQVDLERREFGVKGKGGRVRVVFLSKRASKWVDEYLRRRNDFYKPLFIRYAKGKPNLDDPRGDDKMRLTTRSVQRIVKKYGRKAGVPFEVTPHVLRHSFATDLLFNGAGLREVQEMLGHKNIGTTQIYTHVTNPQLKSVYDKYHSGR